MINYILTMMVTIIAVVVILNYNNKSVSCTMFDDNDPSLHINLDGTDYRITAPEITEVETTVEVEPDAN